MKLKHLFLHILIISITTSSFAQKTLHNISKQEVYSDFVADDSGKRLQGIRVQVLGGDSDITNFNGEFSIKAKIGDKILLSKDGKLINSYIYDGSNQYELDDLSIETESNKRTSNTSGKSIRKRTKNSSFKIAIDSANYLVKTAPEKSIFHIEKALHATSNKKEIAQAYETLADAFYNLKQYDLAESNYQTAYKNQKKSITLQLKLAATYLKNGKYRNSKILYNKVLKAKKVTALQKINTSIGLATIYKFEKNYDKATLHLKNGLELAKKNQIASKITDINSIMAEVLNLQGKISSSQGYMDKSVLSAKKESKKRRIIQNNIAANFYKENNNSTKEIKLRKANLKTLEESELETESTPIPKSISKQKVKYEIGNALEKQKKYPEAIQFFTESAADANVVDDIETEKEAIQGLSEVYAKIGDDSNALLNYQKYTKLVDLVYQQKEDEIAKAIALGKELVTKQNRIFGLEKDRELSQSKRSLYNTEQELISENYRRQKWIIYSLLGGLLLLLLSLFYMFRSNKQRKLANNLLALKSLRSQMNPHFIFNALNSVNSFIASNDERTANRYLTDFSTLMRNVLDNSEQDFIPLEKEMELLHLYLNLEHARFDDKFDFEFNIDDSVTIKNFQIPPMLLQPYVENAVWHGLRYKKEKGLLQINITQQDSENLKITITDNGIGRKKSKELKSKNQLKHQSKGMQNIKQRVAILNEMYPNKVDVLISDLNDDETGTRVVLTLKKD